MTLCIPSLCAPAFLLALIALAGAQPPEQEPAAGDSLQASAPALDPAELKRLVVDLDANEFRVRDDATRALVRAGTPALETLRAARAKAKSAEAKLRLEKVIDEIEVWGGEATDLKLEELLDRVKAIAGEKWSQQGYRDKRLEVLLTRWLRVMGASADNPKLALPVTSGKVTAGGDRSSLRNQLTVVDNGELSFVHDSIILATGYVNVAHAKNSLIIGRLGASVSHTENCVVIGGVSVNTSHVQNSVLVGGRQVRASFLQQSIVACDQVHCSIAQGVTFVNTTSPQDRMRDGSRVVRIPRVILRSPDHVDALKGKLELTFLSSELVLFRLPDGRGEFVARKGKPITDTDGKELPELAGWQLAFSATPIAVFARDDETSVLEYEPK